MQRTIDLSYCIMQMTGGRNAASYRSVLEAISLAATGPGVPSADAAAMAAEGLAVFRAALAAPGPGLDASAFRALAGVLERAGDWQQAVSIFEVMAARVSSVSERSLCFLSDLEEWQH